MNSKISAFLFTSLLLAFSSSQRLSAQTNLDSIYRIWTDASQMDSLRAFSMQNYIQIGFLYSNPDTALILAQEMYDFSEKKGLYKDMGYALLLQSIVHQQHTGKYDEGIALAQKAIPLFQRARAEKGVSQAYTSIGIFRQNIGDNRGALDYFQKSLALAIKLKDKRIEAVLLNNISGAFQNLGEIKEARAYAARGLALAQQMQDIASLNQSYMRLGSLYEISGDYTQAMAYFSQADKGYEAMGDLQKSATIAYFMGSISVKTGNYDTALVFVHNSLRISRDLKNTSLETTCLNLLGAIKDRKGERQEAIALLTQCLRIYESIGDMDGAAAAFGNIGNMYRDQQDYEQARQFYERSAALYDSLGDKLGVVRILSCRGRLLADQGMHDAALAEYERSLQLAMEIGSQQDIAYARQVMGKAYLNQDDLENAAVNCSQALALDEAIGNQTGLIDDLGCLSELAIKRQDYTLAIRHGERAIRIARETGMIAGIGSASFTLYQAYKATGKDGPALEMYELYIQYRDSVENVENVRALLKERFQYEQDKKDALAQAELARRNLQRNASLGGLGLVAVLAGVLFVNGRRRRQTNILLTAQKAEIQAKSNQNELLLKEIHHRVKNSLQTISSLLYLQSAHIKDPEVRDAVAAGQHRVESMALIHQKLYQRDTLAAIEMKDYLSNLVTSLISTFAADPERIRVSLDMPELELDVDTAVPLGLIVNELITNSLKYAFPDGRAGTITVSLQKTGEQLDLLVADDGVGAANTATGTAFGSQLVRLLTAQLGGKLETGSGEGYWTRVRVG